MFYRDKHADKNISVKYLIINLWGYLWKQNEKIFSLHTNVLVFVENSVKNI